jgi:hypothetical protein
VDGVIDAVRTLFSENHKNLFSCVGGAPPASGAVSFKTKYMSYELNLELLSLRVTNWNGHVEEKELELA